MTRSAAVACLMAVIVTAASGLAAQQNRPGPVPAACDSGNGELTLPQGFCAAVVADHLGPARHMAVSPSGDLYVVLQRATDGAPAGAIIALRDTNGDGRFERQQRFGAGLYGTGIAWHDGALFVGSDTAVVRFRMTPGALVPGREPDTIVTFPDQSTHAAKPFAFGRNGDLFVHVGAPSNACQAVALPGSPGENPCRSLSEHGGIWKYDAGRIGQLHDAAHRYATGLRHTTTLIAHPESGTLFQVQQGRDQLDTLWPTRFTARQNAELVGEEMQVVRSGSNWGWPYCYFDTARQMRLLNPEYGGDGRTAGDCATYDAPIAVFPAHTAPLDVLFYTGRQFPQEFRGGAFIAFHGSWNRAPLPMDGYNIRFLPFTGDVPAGPDLVFATGFAGRPQVMAPADAGHRPSGLALARDGSLYVADDVQGRIWKITYTGVQAGRGRS